MTDKEAKIKARMVFADLEPVIMDVLPEDSRADVLWVRHSGEPEMIAMRYSHTNEEDGESIQVFVELRDGRLITDPSPSTILSLDEVRRRRASGSTGSKGADPFNFEQQTEVNRKKKEDAARERNRNNKSVLRSYRIKGPSDD